MRSDKIFFKASGSILDNLELAALCVALLWGVYCLGLFLPFDLRLYGIIPRNVTGLRGIVFAPFLHAGIGHLFSNSLALAPLLFFSLMYSRRLTLIAIVLITLLGGAGTWLFGLSNTVHIGASGVIFGLIGYLLSIGLFRRDLMAMAVSLVVASYYGWALYSLFIVLPGVSWAGHFFGFAAGVIAARMCSSCSGRG